MHVKKHIWGLPLLFESKDSSFDGFFSLVSLAKEKPKETGAKTCCSNNIEKAVIQKKKGVQQVRVQQILFSPWFFSSLKE